MVKAPRLQREALDQRCGPVTGNRWLYRENCADANPVQISQPKQKPKQERK